MSENNEFYFSLPRRDFLGGKGYLEVNCLITVGRDVPLTANYKDKYNRLRSGPDLVYSLKTVCLMGGLHFEVFTVQCL